MSIPYFLYDVFTKTPGGGGPLAVVDCRGTQPLTDDQMQKIAYDFAFPETTFVYPAVDSKHLVQVRIFTPVMELPMAGHPTIGTSRYLVDTGVTEKEFYLELGVGPTKIFIQNEYAFMLQQPCKKRDADEELVEMIPNALGISSSNTTQNEIKLYSAGLEFIIVPVASKQVLYSIVPNRKSITSACARVDNPHIYAFCFDKESDYIVHTRMFNPDPGDGLEDPATGSAAGALAHFINDYYPDKFERNKTLTISQGVTMGRPSEITVSLEKNDYGDLVPKVGGTAVATGSGML